MSYQKKLFLSPFILSLLFIIGSCSPLVYYIGDSYTPTNDVQVFYDIKEIKKEYKVIGRMTKEITLNSEVEKNAMIREAKKHGADGIIFSDITMNQDKKQSDQVYVKAELIKYL
ncbi:MAG TPA: hypothetical protein VNS32_13370 [Flavisolibacter sp.]|nr:hypothetical protein [Flavisolibacter sp.]